MKDLFLLAFLLVVSGRTVAQVNADSAKQVINLSGHLSATDSVQVTIPATIDTLQPAYQKLDSVRTTFTAAADSIRTEYRNAISRIGELTNDVNKSIDSVQRLNLEAGHYTQQLDSLGKLSQAVGTKCTSKLNELKSTTTTTEKLNSLDLPPEYQEPLDKLTQNVNTLDINTDPVKIPGLNVPKLDGIPDIAPNGLGDVGNTGDLAGLPKIETPAGNLGNITEEAKGYQHDLENLSSGKIQDVERFPETIEEQASKIDGVDELQKQSGVIDEHKATVEELADPNKGKEKAKQLAKKVAVDHFAGKQEQLKAAMDKISKYKQKYSSVSSIKDLPKRAPNPMKGKPFIERVIPGLSLQYMRSQSYLLDVNPYLGYRVSGRFTTGLGWNHRYAYDSDIRSFNSRSRIFGPRVYVDFKLGKGFIVHLEGEVMDTFVPSVIFGNPDTGRREWVWSVMTGIKKEYRVYKSLKGTALIQYNLFDRYYKSPYLDRLNSRIGFEYVLKKRK